MPGDSYKPAPVFIKSYAAMRSVEFEPCVPRIIAMQWLPAYPAMSYETGQWKHTEKQNGYDTNRYVH